MFKSKKLLSGVLVLAMLAGCASNQPPGEAIHINMDETPSPDARPVKFQVKVRLANYQDVRDIPDPRMVGVATARVLGMTGKELVLDSEVASLVAASMKKRLSDDGLQFVAPDKAQFQLSGLVKTLSMEIKERDHMDIVIESTLTEISSGRVIWSGAVAEKKSRFGGVSGNTKDDVAVFLKNGLATVSRKTSESILSVLMENYPDLFGAAGLAKAAPGVTVYTAVPGIAQTVVSAPAPVAATVNSATATGMLVLTSAPDRAKVYVDDVYYGLTPLEVEMPAGIYQLGFVLDGYKKSGEKVAVRRGARTELNVKLSR